MSEPTHLRPPVTSGVVAILTDLLRRAQAGEVAQLALVSLNPDGKNYFTWISDRDAATPGGHDTLKLIGAVADLQFTLLTLHNGSQD